MYKRIIKKNKSKFLNELKDFLKIPSVGSLSKYNKDTFEAAEFLKEKIIAAGADKAYLINDYKHPILYAEKIIDKKLPYLLIYGHYDVQPAEKEKLWNSPPFTPTIKNEKIFARGAADDKSQIFIHIKALEILNQTKTFPCNLKYIIEGEEEEGSTSLFKFLDEKNAKNILKTNAIVVSDTDMVSLDNPSMPISTRGIITANVELIGPKKDLHSGLYGGSVPNPIFGLSHIISKLIDVNNRITIPNFYKDVKLFTDHEKAYINNTPFNIEEYKKEIGASRLTGEKGFSTLEHIGIRPSIDVNGIWSGYTSLEGFKTIIPSKAFAKLSIRTVPNQNAKKIGNDLKSFIEEITPKGFNVNVEISEHSEYIISDINSTVLKAASKSFLEVWEKSLIFTRGGGSIPILAKLKEVLNAEVAMLGFGLPSDSIHSPNENFGLVNFYKGIETVINFYKNFTAIHKESEK